MEMSAAYLAETARALAEAGFQLTEETWDEEATPAGPGWRGTRFRLSRGKRESFVLEAVHHDSGEVSYFLEIACFHGLQSHSFPLDSWKHFSNRVEFKFYTMPDTGMGLSVTLELEAPS